MEAKNELYPTIPQVNEIRIGNILFDEEKEVVNIEQIHSDRLHYYVKVSINDGEIYSSNLYKIPITEDWLKKLGFIKDTETNYRWFLPGYSIAFDLDDYCIRIADSWEFGQRMYVNELQNLIFALTGKELLIKN